MSGDTLRHRKGWWNQDFLWIRMICFLPGRGAYVFRPERIRDIDLHVFHRDAQPFLRGLSYRATHLFSFRGKVSIGIGAEVYEDFDGVAGVPDVGEGSLYLWHQFQVAPKSLDHCFEGYEGRATRK